MQATMFLAQPKRARLLVLHYDNPRVTMPMLDITFHPPANRARPLVLLEPLAARQDRARVLTLQQDILCHLLVRRVRLHAVLVTIKHPPVKHPVMLLMLATMFRAQPKAARLLVLLEQQQSKHWVYEAGSSAETSATACSPGYYQASSGQTSCDAADAGYYVSGTAQTSQTACAAGTYQASTGQSSCDDADAGYYVSGTAQTSQTVCAANLSSKHRTILM